MTVADWFSLLREALVVGVAVGFFLALARGRG
jgi:hypothetical protein